MQSKLEVELCRHMLFLRVFTTLDTTYGYFTSKRSRFSNTTYIYHERSCGNSTTCNMTPSDIVESSTHAISFSEAKKPQR